MSTIYRKYRPQAFVDLVGQEHIVQTIANEISTGNVAHAYLFSGPRGVGKTTMARLLAKAVNCPNRQPNTFEPCDQCPSCTEISAGHNIDVIEIDAASHTGVDNVRENIIDNAQFKPTISPYKVFIIDEVHMLSTAAFNALLKTLEEPPSHVIFIMATTEINKVLPTIVSRCQRFLFKKIPGDIMLAKLKKIVANENVDIAEAVLKKITIKSEGCLRDAESILGQILSMGLKNITEADATAILPNAEREEALNYLEASFSGQTKSAIQVVAGLSENGRRPDDFALDILNTLRLMLIVQTGHQPEELVLLEKTAAAKVAQLAKQATTTQLVQSLDKALLRAGEIKQSPIPQLPLEVLAVEIAEIFNKTNSVLPPSQTTSAIPPMTPDTNSETSATKSTDSATLPPPVLNTEAIPEESKKPTLGAAIKEAVCNMVCAENTDSEMSLEHIKEYWTKLIVKINRTNPSLNFILNMCTVDGIKKDTMEIGIPYAFHRDKIMEKKNLQLVESALEEIAGRRFRLDFVVTAKTPAAEEKTEIADDLALSFGGEVVG